MFLQTTLYYTGWDEKIATNFRLLSILNRSSDSWQIYSSNSWLYCLQSFRIVIVWLLYIWLENRKLSLAPSCVWIFCVAYHRSLPWYWQRSSTSRKWTKNTATSAEMVRKIKKWLDRNPRRSGRKMACELNISLYAIRQILKSKLVVKPLKIQKLQDLTEAQKKLDS